MDPTLPYITLIRAPEGSTCTLGQSWAPLASALPWTVGRAPTSCVALPDPSVSREHALIERVGRAWHLSNVSSNNGLYLDGEPIAPGQRVALKDTSQAHVQVGKLMLRLEWLQQTQPHTQPVELPTREPLLRVVRDGDCCVVYCKGKRVDLKPSSALALYALGQRPGQIMHTWDILDTIDRELDLPQAISGARRALRALLERGELTQEEVIEAILATSTQQERAALLAQDHAALVRLLVFSRRGHGYGLALPADQIEAATED